MVHQINWLFAYITADSDDFVVGAKFSYEEDSEVTFSFGKKNMMSIYVKDSGRDEGERRTTTNVVYEKLHQNLPELHN